MYSNVDPYRKRHRARARKYGARGVFDHGDVLARLAQQDDLCHYCGAPVEYDGPRKFQVDHFIPMSRGGSNWAANIVIACPGCNSAKGEKLPWEYRPARFEEGCSRDG